MPPIQHVQDMAAIGPGQTLGQDAAKDCFEQIADMECGSAKECLQTQSSATIGPWEAEILAIIPMRFMIFTPPCFSAFILIHSKN